MKPDREQIKKDLEICGNGCWGDCPYLLADCKKELPKKALALIRELTEENEKIGIENFDLVCELSRIREAAVREIFEPIINALKYTRFASPLEKKSTLDYIYSLREKYIKDVK